MVFVRRSVVLLVILAFAFAPSAASASPEDVASTHTAIVAGYALARAGVATIPVAQSKIQHYKRKLAGQCPNAAAGALENEAAQPMSHEVAVALWSIAYGSAAGPIRKFVKVIKPLHWTNPRVNRAAHSFASNLSGLASIPLPDLCADIRSWVATGFTKIPQHVLELDRHVETLELPEIQWKLVRPYVRGGDASLVSYIKRAERKIAEAEFMLGQKDWYQVCETLGLPP
jgi:hypothetical protein